MTAWLLPLAVGFATGILSAWGVGGGTLLLLCMTLLLGVDQRTAQTINLLYFLPTAGMGLLSHGKSGLLYPYGDAAACARQIQILMDDPQLARSLGQAGQKAMEPFRLEAVFPCVMAEYDRLLSPAPALV